LKLLFEVFHSALNFFFLRVMLLSFEHIFEYVWLRGFEADELSYMVIPVHFQFIHIL